MNIHNSEKDDAELVLTVIGRLNLVRDKCKENLFIYRESGKFSSKGIKQSFQRELENFKYLSQFVSLKINICYDLSDEFVLYPSSKKKLIQFTKDTKKWHTMYASIFLLVKKNLGLLDVRSQTVLNFIVCTELIVDVLDSLGDKCNIRKSMDSEKIYSLLYNIAGEKKITNPFVSNSFSMRNDYKELVEIGRYLVIVAKISRCELNKITSNEKIKSAIKKSMFDYSYCITVMHEDETKKQELLTEWYDRKNVRDRYSLTKDEWLLANGSSTFPFALVSSLLDKDFGISDVDKLYDIYYPYLGLFHVWQDDLVDVVEDEKNNDFNINDSYIKSNDCQDIEKRLKEIVDIIMEKIERYGSTFYFHKFIVLMIAEAYLKKNQELCHNGRSMNPATEVLHNLSYRINEYINYSFV
ncbi:DUF2600 family protein [Patescibacteria group bacterium]|nr:DUF2600 family protein [Patescibacteria group bacterium]